MIINNIDRKEIFNFAANHFNAEQIERLFSEIENSSKNGRVSFFGISQNKNLLQFELVVLTQKSILSFKLDKKGISKDLLFYNAITGISQRIETNKTTVSIHGGSLLKLDFSFYGDAGHRILQTFINDLQYQIN